MKAKINNEKTKQKNEFLGISELFVDLFIFAAASYPLLSL